MKHKNYSAIFICFIPQFLGISLRNFYLFHSATFRNDDYFPRNNPFFRLHPHQINTLLQTLNAALRSDGFKRLHQAAVNGINRNLFQAFAKDGEIAIRRVRENFSLNALLVDAVVGFHGIHGGQGIHATHAGDVALSGRQLDRDFFQGAKIVKKLHGKRFTLLIWVHT